MRLRVLFALFPAGIIASASMSTRAAACDTKVWRDAIRQYSQRHPRAEGADLYKLVHQGIMGSEHAVTGLAAADAWMQRELKTLSRPAAGGDKESAAGGDKMIEQLPPDGRFVRVNLRPFIAAGGDASSLVRAFVATANESKGDTTQFACVERSLPGSQPAVTNALLSLIRERRKSGFDATHHSDAFEAAYRPAYRVVRASLADSLLPNSRRSATNK